MEAGSVPFMPFYAQSFPADAEDGGWPAPAGRVRSTRSNSSDFRHHARRPPAQGGHDSGIPTAFPFSQKRAELHGHSHTSVTKPAGGPPQRACLYPHFRFHSRARRTPSAMSMSRCQPRQIDCHPGVPSCLRPRKPPSFAIATNAVSCVHPPGG